MGLRISHTASGRGRPLDRTGLPMGHLTCCENKHMNSTCRTTWSCTMLTWYTKAVWKVHGLTLLLRVRTLWRCGDRLFFESPPLASDSLLTTLHPLLKNMLQTVDHFKISCLLEAPFSWLEKPRNRMERDLNWILCSAWKKWIDGTPLEYPLYRPNLAPMRFLFISNHEKGAPRQEISKWSTVCSMFSRSGWSVVRGTWLAKGGTSKKRQSLHLHKVPNRSNKLSPQTSQAALVRFTSAPSIKPFEVVQQI
jgi:hypothetical protein